MPKYSFEVQSLEKVTIEAENIEQARLKLINNIDYYVDLYQNCDVSNGEPQK